MSALRYLPAGSLVSRLPETRHASGDEWVRPVMATVLTLLLLAIPHHRLFIWLSDGQGVHYWKEAMLAVGYLAYGWAVVRRFRLSRTELRAMLLAAPFLIAVLVRLGVGLIRNEDAYLLFIGGGNLGYYAPAFLLPIYLLQTSDEEPARQVERALYLILIATTLAAVLSVVDNVTHFSGQFDFFGRERVEADLDYDSSIWRSSATYQSPMILGLISGMGLLVSLYFFVRRFRDRPRSTGKVIAFASLVLLHLVGMYLTFSRGPLVAVTGGAVIIALLGSRGGLDWQGLAASWKKYLVGAVGLGLVVAAVVLLLPEPLQAHLGSIVDWSGDQNNTTRLRRMAMGVEKFRDAPLIGKGLGSAQPRLAHYRFKELGREFFFTNPESQILTWAVEGGLMLLLPALAIVGFMVHTSFAMSSAPDRPDLRQLGVLFLGLQGALYAEGLIMPVLNSHTFQLGFWVLFGTLVYFRTALYSGRDGRTRTSRTAARGTEP